MITVRNASKIYKSRQGEIAALNGCSLQVEKGEFIVILGPSGSGKSTLLLTLGGMLKPTTGEVIIHDQNLYSLSNPKRAEFRAQHIGFVFQMFHLIPYLTVLENVMLSSNQNGSAREHAEEWLNRVGLRHRLHHKPSELSAGEKQRTAIARALISHPDLILADEPTGNLDSDNATEIMRHLHEYQKTGGTVILVTHGQFGYEFATRVIRLRDGKIVQEERNSLPEQNR